MSAGSVPVAATAAANVAEATARPVVIAGMPPYATRLLRWSFAIGVVPPLVLVLALALKSFYLLMFIHVFSGATWTGFDLFMGLVMSRILRLLDIPGRVEIAKRLVPTQFFILPSLAATAVTAGIYLSISMGKFDLGSPWILAGGVIVLALLSRASGSSCRTASGSSSSWRRSGRTPTSSPG